MNATFPARAAAIVAATLLAGVTLLAGGQASADPVIIFLEDCPGGGDPPPTPGPNCTPREDSVVRGKRSIAFTVDAGQFNRLRRVDVFILATEPGLTSPGNPPGSQVRRWDWPDVGTAPRNSGTLRFTWDTAVLTPSNGVYKIRVTASTHSPDSTSSTSERKDISVDNVPETPAKPVVLAANKDGVSLQWTGAPEPDFLSFTLYRARTGSASDEPAPGDFIAVGITQNTDAFDAVDEGGAYWYKLQSTRRSVVTPETGISSALSARSDQAGVVVKPTPKPDEGGGGGGRGGKKTSKPDDRTIVSPALTPRPLPSLNFRAPPVPDAPFSQILPYELGEDGEVADLPQAADDFDDVDGEDQRQGAVSAVAIGMFLVSAALVIGRVPA